MRIHNYPAVPQGTVIKPGQLRCGVHTDFTSITLLFADRPGGLQVSLQKYTHNDAISYKAWKVQYIYVYCIFIKGCNKY